MTRQLWPAFTTPTGRARHPRICAEGGAPLRDFARALNEVLMDLVLQVIRDGEGASKLVRIDVSEEVSAKSAKTVAMAIDN